MSILSMRSVGLGVDQARRVLLEGEQPDRIQWRLFFEDGSSLHQFQRVGDNWTQVLFGKIKAEGVRSIVVHDAYRRTDVHSIAVPLDAKVDILQNVTASIGDSLKESRVYSFGWSYGDKSHYMHVAIEGKDLVFKFSKSRIV